LAGGEGAEKKQSVALVDDPDPLLRLLGEDTAENAASFCLLRRSLLGHEGRLFLEPEELGMAMGEAGAGGAALVDERLDIGEALLPRGSDPILSSFGDLLDLPPGEVGERSHVPG
jgi:hypothetical protein